MAKKKKKGTGGSKKPQKPKNYIKQAARKLPIGECLALPGWDFSGMTHIVVPRQKANGGAVVGHYMLDTFCLGLKNTHYIILKDQFEYEEHIALLTAHQDFEPIEPALAFNLIYGAIEYAEDHGFEPHKDFEITEYILPDVEDIEYIDIEFGKDGKPFYVSGPHDNVEKIMATLNKNLKEGEFDFAAHVNGEDYEEESDEEIEARIAAFFPEDRINKKLDTLEQQDKILFNLYVNAAEVLLDMCNGDIDILKEFLSEEDFFKDALEILTEEVSDDDVEKTEHENQAIQKFLSRNLTYMSEKLLQYGDIEFLLEDDFLPSPKFPTDEEMEQMTEEEFQKHNKQLSDSMTVEESNKFYFQRIFEDSIIVDDEAGVAIPKLNEDVDSYYNKVFTKINNALVSNGGTDISADKNVLRVYFDDILKRFWEVKKD